MLMIKIVSSIVSILWRCPLKQSSVKDLVTKLGFSLSPKLVAPRKFTHLPLQTNKYPFAIHYFITGEVGPVCLQQCETSLLLYCITFLPVSCGIFAFD